MELKEKNYFSQKTYIMSAVCDYLVGLQSAEECVIEIIPYKGLPLFVQVYKYNINLLRGNETCHDHHLSNSLFMDCE